MFQLLYSHGLLSFVYSIITAFLVHTVGLGVWRVYFSPLAKFPGPKLTGLTYWYEFYYDFVKRREFLFHIRDLHQQYGPIVRINPHELHFCDIEFYPTLYSRGSSIALTRNRDPWHTACLTLDESILASPDQKLHRHRRAALSPFFSMSSTRRLLPLVQERISTLMAKLEEKRDTGTAVSLLHAFSALSDDIVFEFCFGTSEHRVEAPEFDLSYYKNVIGAAEATIALRHFPFLVSILKSMPYWLMMKLEGFASQEHIKVVLRAQIEEARLQQGTGMEDNIFYALINSDLSEADKSDTRLVDEAVVVVGAGSHTVAWATTVATCYLLSNPSILQKLKDELKTIPPTEDVSAFYARLEKLPYLTGVVKESLRLSHGVSLRLPHIAPQQDLVYKDWVIPAGVSVAMTPALIHLDPNNFANPEAFQPERWVEDTTGKLDKCLAAFSGGGRKCLGINIAWAELYLIIAGLYGDFGGMGKSDGNDWKIEGRKGVMELFETSVEDVVVVGDNLFPVVQEGSQGVRVLIKS